MADEYEISEDEIVELLQMFTSYDTGFCLYPRCRAAPSNNHSISKKIALAHLSHNGRVVAPYNPPKGKPFLAGHMGSFFKPVGINQASAFKGLCLQHDNQLWAELDNISYMDLPSYTLPGTAKWTMVQNADELTSKFAFLLLYRAMMHASSKQVAFLRHYLARDYVKFGTPEKFGDPFAHHILVAMTILRHKVRLDDLYMRKQWSSVIQRGVRIAPCDKTWSYSQFIFFDDVTPLHPAGASFTLLPGMSECLLACVTFREYEEELQRYLERHWREPGDPMFRASVSKLALQDSENLYIHPQFWQKLGKKRQKKIQQFWYDTAFYGAVPYYVDEDLNLFNPPQGGIIANE